MKLFACHIRYSLVNTQFFEFLRGVERTNLAEYGIRGRKTRVRENGRVVGWIESGEAKKHSR